MNSLLRVKEEFADNAGVDVEDFKDIDFEIDIPEYASGGRIGLKNGEGIMQMASAPDPMDERNSMMENIAMQEFGKPLSDLSEEEIIQIENCLWMKCLKEKINQET